MFNRTFLYGAVASLSGCSALVFENLWFRSSALALGSGVWSSVLVLSAFMAGLAVGNALAMQFDTRLRRPLRAYAFVECAIGATGVAALVLLGSLTAILGPVFGSLHTPSAINVVRVCAAFLVLVIPAASMGATLPLLMKSLAEEPGPFGKWLGTIYGANTAGAVVGVIGCEVILVPAVGVYGAGFLAACLNAIAGVLAMRLERRTPYARRPKKKATPLQDARPRWALLAAGFFCGVVFLSYEAVFFRFQLLFFTSLSTTFAVMLAVVLAGIALGGMGAGRMLARDPQAESWLPVVAIASGLTLLLSYRWFPAALELAVGMSPAAGALVTTMALAFPVAGLSGVMFTLIGHALHAAGHTEIRATALLTIVNTLGGAVGSVLTGFYLISGLGLEACFLAVIVAYGAIGVWLVVAIGPQAMARRGWLVSSAVALAIGVPLFPRDTMRDVYLAFPISALTRLGEARVAFREGQLDTLQYLRADVLGHPEYYRLIVNNHSMSASDVRSRRYMRLFAYLPRILHPAPRRAALVGLGLGVTAKALTDDDRLESIDVVDISRDIPDMIRVVYPGPGESPLDDARVRLHVEDGRFFLQTSAHGYDIITGEPPPPHYTGVAGLYSREFFQLVRRRLNPGGIVTYWLPVHDLKAAEAQSITRAFLDVFPDGSLWTGSGFEWVLMGTTPPVRQAASEQFADWWRHGPRAESLQQIGIESPEMLGALFLADGARLHAWAQGAPALTDNFPRRVSLGAPRDDSDMAAFLAILNAPDAARNFASSPLIGALWPTDLRARTDTVAFDRQARVNTMLSLPRVTLRDLQALLGEGRPDPLLVKALFWRHAFDVDHIRSLLHAAPQATGDDVAEFRAEVEMMEGRFKEAAEWLGQVSAARAPRVMVIRMYCLARAGSGPA